MMLPYLALRKRRDISTVVKLGPKDDKSGVGIPLFFHGPLQNHKLLTRLMRDGVSTKSIVLNGFEKQSDKSYASMVKSDKGRVQGVQVMITKKQRQILDRWESRYNRTLVEDAKTGKKYWAYELKKIVLL